MPELTGPQRQAFEASQAAVRKLVDNFLPVVGADYPEHEVRKDFIDKFWIALGWDVNHERQINPYEQEVRVERAMTGPARGRRADYAFRLAPNFQQARFFVEAKRPGAPIDDADSCFQVTRYGWSSGVPLSVLTSFEQFMVFDCRYKPDIDSARSRELPDLRLHFTDYRDSEKFAKIYFLFSRDSVAQGSLERYADLLPRPRGAATQRGLFPAGRFQPVDESFLNELDDFRADLARSFKRDNPGLDGEQLTEVTQRTLDRLVFMRFLEDKLIETDPIVEQFGTHGSAWRDFVAASRRLDRLYNGIIFKEHALLDSPSFHVDEDVFEAIREKLAHTNSPYALHYIPIYILGSIYERFLGKVIVATDRRADVREKPEVRKAGGVYYTPEYVVRYIVENTVGSLIADRRPEEIAEMRFADIACGSGSFLLGIYDALLRHHTGFYNANTRNRSLGIRAGCIKDNKGQLHLSLRQKRDILTNNIYGLDIDPQAVEVAQLSLYLRLLEEETPASARAYQLQFGESLLPSLNANVVCGNSLVEWDILEGRLFDTDEEKHLKPRDFEALFPSAMKNGGFDAVIGNPPYVRIQTMGQETLDYYARKFVSAVGNFDLYCLFLEKAFNSARSGGAVGFILPHRFFKTDYGQGLRAFLAGKNAVSQIVDFDGYMVFGSVSINTCVLILNKKRSVNRTLLAQNVAPNAIESQIAAAMLHLREPTPFFRTASIPTATLGEEPWIFISDDEAGLWAKMNRVQTRLRDVALHIFQGFKTGADAAYIGEVIEEGRKTVILRFGDGSQEEIETPVTRKLVKGGDMKRYCLQSSSRRIIFPYVNGVVLGEREIKEAYPCNLEASPEKTKCPGGQGRWNLSRSRMVRLHAESGADHDGQCQNTHPRLLRPRVLLPR